jgi:hypothetical protein
VLISEPPQELSASATPSDSALLDWLRPGISRLMLEEIAANDYGEEIAEHLTAIEKQLSEAPLRGFLPWCPREVLELERFAEPDIPSRDDSATKRRRHWKRILACTLLLQSAATTPIESLESIDESFLDTSASTLIRLTQSAIAVSEDCPKQALSFMLWFIRELSYLPLRPFAAFCTLLLWLHWSPKLNCDAIVKLSQWIIDEEQQCRTSLSSEVASERWLVGLSIYEDRTGHREVWFRTAFPVMNAWDKCGSAVDELRKRVAAIDRD